MREPWEWDESDIQAMVTGKIEETISLDYKRSESLQRDPAKITELTKDVSSFANSAGGALVYGVFEDPADRRLPGGIDAGIDPKVISREWIEQTINGKIQRRIDGVRINPISLSGAKAGRVVYVIYVPQSVRTPHQAGDKKFYKRYNFLSEPMEEYEVRDLYGRQEVPDLDLTFRLTDEPYVSLSYDEPTYSKPIEIRTSLTNDSVTPTDYAVIDFLIDSELRIERFPNYDQVTQNFAGD